MLRLIVITITVAVIDTKFGTSGAWLVETIILGWFDSMNAK